MKFHIHSDKTLSVATNCPEETYELGRRLGALAFPGLLVLLNGTLGAGKTKFTQGFGAALGYSRVKSPSFIIMSEYDGPLPMLHADLYRLEGSSEAETLGIEEYLEDGFTALVEWAERWREPEAEEMIIIDIQKMPGHDEKREIILKAEGKKSKAALRLLSESKTDAEMGECGC